jgi:hypothetical protein
MFVLPSPGIRRRRKGALSEEGTGGLIKLIIKSCVMYAHIIMVIEIIKMRCSIHKEDRGQFDWQF